LGEKKESSDLQRWRLVKVMFNHSQLITSASYGIECVRKRFSSKRKSSDTPFAHPNSQFFVVASCDWWKKNTKSEDLQRWELVKVMFNHSQPVTLTNYEIRCVHTPQRFSFS
jgi:hypothetical protein